ncbi:hypothetical protein CSB45_09870 [candidate division KSB3 bacterium]|uniref:Uncharacterized protein n=1 Tax=candidate division KSB3 bacterium TaxID=2044937 RepID=A0A2G6E3V9_9BACT|nr:MAG: hypothetical protein CSB45_09870 [candidate division KSB3 bacterium]PIE29374.1 MAG: hypothetical protein CSA57_09220 [candidate division KSB3 bacterium]
MMMCRSLRSHNGFSLVKILLLFVMFALAILYYLPHINGTTLTVVNQIGDRVKGVVNDLKSKVILIKHSFSNSLDSLHVKVSRKLADLLDKLNLKKLSKQIKGVQDAWERDMSTLLEASRSRGFNVSEMQKMYDEYNAGERSWRRVESFYWDDMQAQTQKAVQKSFEHFLERPIGCSDFSQELKTIWEIGERFNEGSFSGYTEAKALSDTLYNPRSVDFVTELFEWLRVAGLYASPPGDWRNDWFIRQLITATATGENVTPDYPATIQMITSQVGNHEVYRILGDITIAEIYLNYNLLHASIQYYEDAISSLSAIARQKDARQPYSRSTLGIHMALGLLHERMCSNSDLASKEFKDVIAIARRLNLPCNQYNQAHYHLAVLNLQIRERSTIQPQFTQNKEPVSVTAEELLQEKPAASPSETADGVITGTIGDGQVGSRAMRPSTGTPDPGRKEHPLSGGTPPGPLVTPTPSDYYAPGEIILGTILPGKSQRRRERDIRLRPRQELGGSLKMETFKLEQLYDLGSIPEDAVREFELYLKCQSRGEDTVIARYVLSKYYGR